MSNQNLLGVSFAGYPFQNPVLTASGTSGNGPELSQFTDLSALGGFVTKAVTLDKRHGNKNPRIQEVQSGMLNSIGLQNTGVDEFLSTELPWLVKHLRDSRAHIIVNISGFNINEYIEVSRRISNFAEEHGVSNIQFFELNVSCPNENKVPFGVDPDATAEIVREVRKVTSKKIQLIVKLTPASLFNIADIALAAEEAGADAISAINTIPAIDIDIRTQEPVLGNIAGGLSGAAILPVGLKAVYDVYKKVKIPIIGIGGIRTHEDVLKYIFAGATAVGIGTYGMRSPSIFQHIINNLHQYCLIHGTTISALIGAAHIAPY
jgi:dihydroorotate dehydrogenase (NAD+) catalytic subunit